MNSDDSIVMFTDEIQTNSGETRVIKILENFIECHTWMSFFPTQEKVVKFPQQSGMSQTAFPARLNVIFCRQRLSCIIAKMIVGFRIMAVYTI